MKALNLREDEKFVAALSPLGMELNKGMWAYYKNWPSYQEMFSITGTPARACFMLNQKLNGHHSKSIGNWANYYSFKYTPEEVVWEEKEKYLVAYEKAIEALNA